MLKFIGSLSFIWLLMATSTMAQSPAAVLDTDGRPLRRGLEYHVLPAATDTAGGLTLINRTGCPLYVGQEPLSPVVSQGLPVIFTPVDGDSIVREGRDFGIVFSAATICVQSTAWSIGERDSETSRRFIVTGGEQDFFNIVNNDGLYNFRWCPNCDRHNCPRPLCGDAGIVIENGNRLLVLDGPAFPFRFRRVNQN